MTVLSHTETPLKERPFEYKRGGVAYLLGERGSGTTPHHTTPHHTTPHHTTPHHITSHHITSQHITTTSHYTALHDTITRIRLHRRHNINKSQQPSSLPYTPAYLNPYDLRTGHLLQKTVFVVACVQSPSPARTRLWRPSCLSIGN